MASAKVVELPVSESSSYLGVSIDKNRDAFLSDQAFKLLKDYYCNDTEDTPQKAFARASVAYSDGDQKFAQRTVSYTHLTLPTNREV